MWSDDEDSLEEVVSVAPEDAKEKFLWAAGSGKIQIMEDLLIQESSMISYRDDQGYTALHRAASEGQEEAVNFLLSHGADVAAQTVDGWTPLHCACKWNEARIATLLLLNGSDVNACSSGGITPLHAAASSNSRAVLLLLLNDDDIDTSVRTSAGDTARDLATRHSSHSPLFDIAASHINMF